MGWYQQRKSKFSNKLSDPHPNDGSDGDIQVRQTSLGGKLFAKLGGRWHNTYLTDDANIKIGTNTRDHLSIKPEGIDVIKDSVKVANFGSTVTVGEVGSGKSNVHITAGSIELRNNTTAKITLNSDGDVAISGNITMGKPDGSFNTTDNIYMGQDQGDGVGYQNVCIGYRAGKSHSATTAGNVLIGLQSGYNIVSATGEGSNVCVGPSSGASITSGKNNVCIGSGANGGAALIEQIAIGLAVTCDASETIRIGDNSNYIFYDFASGGAVTITSDERIKKDIVNTDIGLDFINALRPIKYTPKEKHEYPGELFQDGVNTIKEGDKKVIGSKRLDGFVAQDVKEAMDNLGVTFSGWNKNESSRQMLGYSTFVVPLTKAVQELSAKVDEMQTQINNLT